MTRGFFGSLLTTACLSLVLLAGCSSNNTSTPPIGPGPNPQPDGGGQVWPDAALTEAGLPQPMPDAGQLPGVEAGTTINPCAGPGGGERAVIVAAGDYDDVTKGTAALLQINRNGLLTDTQVRLGPIDQPRAVAIRPDGQEAAISFGASSSDGSKAHGVVLISVGAGGSQASLIETKTLPGNAGPLYLNYITADTLAVSRLGPEIADVVPLNRQAGGQLAIGTPFTVPGGTPQNILAIPRGASEALLLSAPMGQASQLHRLSFAGGAISALGAPVILSDRHFRFTMHPSVNAAYLPLAESTGSTSPDPPGKLIVYSATAGGAWGLDPNPFKMPKYAGTAAVSPTGEMIVLADEITGTGQTELYAIKLDAAGKAVSVIPSFATFPASMIFDLAVTQEGHIVVSLLPQASGKSYDVISFARISPTGWFQCPNKVSFRGAAELQIAPAS